MITSKFIWESFEKYSDRLFYINDATSVTYKGFILRIKQIANHSDMQSIENKKVALALDSSLDSLFLFFAIIYNGATPVLVSANNNVDSVIKSIDCEKVISPIDFNITNKDSSAKTNQPLGSKFGTIIFTSGSTSTPKAILHSYSNHYYSAIGSNENISLDENDRWLLSLPMNHIGGLSIIFRSLLAGSTLVAYDKSISLSENVEMNKITHLSVVATQLKRLLKEPSKLNSLKAVLVGGGMTPENLVTDAVAANLPIYKTYGMSEMSSQVTTTTSNATIDDLQTSGKILSHRKICISDKNEILVRGKVLCEKYLNAKIDIDSEGWFHTGDIGSLDSNGNLKVLGRIDNMFISGGENIYPEPLEKIIMQMDGIDDVCIVPKDNLEFGEVPVLFYKTNNAKEYSVSDLKKYLKDKVRPFEIPKELFLFPDEYHAQGIKLNRSFLTEWLKN